MTPSLEHATAFLSKIVPWPKDGEDGYVNIHHTYQGEGHSKPGWGGRACRSLNEAINAIEFVLGNASTRDIYVCMSRQSAAKEKTSKTGRKYYTPIRNQPNALALKSLFLDIDIKDNDSGYPDLDLAAAALKVFIKKTGLPNPSAIVRSGGGLHVYWTMDRALTPQEWQPLANALAEATKREDFKCDTAVTIDCARVLRIPNTWNKKTDPPRPVKLVSGKVAESDYSVERLEKALAPYKVAKPTPSHPVDVRLFDSKTFPSYSPLEGQSPLSAGIYVREEGMTADEIRACLDVIPNDKVDWTRWNTMGMRVFAACGGASFGRDEWERWSATNPNAGDKDNCADRWETFHTSPPTRTGAGALVNEARAATRDPKWMPPRPAQLTGSAGGSPVIDQSDMPDGYRREADGTISRLVRYKDGSSDYVRIWKYPLWEPWLQECPGVLHFTTVRPGKKLEKAIEFEHLGGMSMRACLHTQDLILPPGPKGTEYLTEFLMSWVQKLQESKDSVKSAPFGWSVDVRTGQLEGFVFAGRVWTPAGNRPAANPDLEIQRQYTPTGQAEPWADAIKLVTGIGRSDLDAIVAASFGAPLVRFTGQQGLQMSVYSSASGIGKTTALKAAQAVWGDPVSGLQGLGDTKNAVINKIGQIRHLPLFWDELKTDEQVKKYVELTFEVTGGREKARMTQNVQQRKPGTWQTMLVSASNDSLRDQVLGSTKTTTAGLYRLFEYEVKKSTKGQINSSDAQRSLAKLNDNFGQIGLEYAKFLGANFEQLDEEVGSFLRALTAELGASNDERFWMALITCICMGARYANQLKFTSIDEHALKSFLVAVLVDMRTQGANQTVDMHNVMNVSNQLAQFLNAMRGRNTLITDRIHIAQGRPAPNGIKILCDVSRVDAVYVQKGVEDKLLRFSSTYFNHWLRQQEFPQQVFTEAFKREFGMQKVRGRLAAGTSLQAGAVEYLFEIDLCHPAAAKFIDE
jgi:hypothetical protein